jgi:tRNA dimethylallyltransferase
MDTPLVIIAGPTASGKSGLALAVAEKLDGSVINADSMQVYRDLAILTSRPGAHETARVPHRLYGVLDGASPCSAVRWRDMAREEISTAAGQGRLPVCVGGTGLYLRTLIRGLAAIPDIPEAVRHAARARHRELGGEAFHGELAARDLETAARLHVNDRQRLIRAWEVLEATGRGLSDWQKRHTPQEGLAAGVRSAMIVLMPPREALYGACDERFWRMMEDGLMDEVRALDARGLDPSLPVMKAVGLREMLRYCHGEISLEEAVSLAQRSTRRYAKRQMTWLRHQLDHGKMESMIIEDLYEKTQLPEIFSFLHRFLLSQE